MLISEDQIQELYEINNDPKRKEFLDDLFSFMQKRGSPINRLPIMAKSVLDLYELYNLVIARGGLVDVINKKLWQEIIKGLNLPSSITSAAFTLRTQYMKYLYPYECEKKNLSTPAELQAAIDGNRREGRRSSYGQYEAMHSQMQMPQMSRQSMQQMSPLALVTNNQQAQAAAAAAAVAHHRMLAPTFGQVPNLVSHEIEQRMMEYLKMIQVKKEQCAAVNAGGVVGGGAGSMSAPHQQQQRHRSQSPEISTRDALNTLEMSRLALWQMYHNNTSPPASVNTSPQGGLGVGCSISATSGVGGGGGGGGGSERGGGSSSGGNGVEPQRSEALNLSDSPPIKREREREPSQERDDFMHQPPPTKRSNSGFPVSGFPVNFYLPTAAGAAANFHHPTHDSDMENEEENEDDGEHNTTTNSSNHEHDEESDVRQQQVNGHLSHHHHHQHQPHHQQHHLNNNRRHLRSSNGSGHHDKSDDSAIENSPSTSTSAGNGHISPVSTKKIHLVKPHNSGSSSASGGNHGQHDDEDAALGSSTSIGPLETLSLLSSMQFRVTRNGTGTNGEQQLIVNLELNGIRYSGMLVANTTATTVTGAGVVATTKRTLSARVTPTATTTAAATAGVAHKSTSNSNNNSKKHEVSNSTDEDNEDDLMETEATSEQDADEETDTTNAATMLAAVAAAATASAVGSDISPKATKCESTTGAPLANGPSSNAALKDTLITTATT